MTVKARHGPGSLIVDPGTWLRAFLSREYTVSLPLYGHSSVSADWKVPLRSIPEHLVYFVVNNVCEGRIEKSTFCLEPGTFSWIMAGVQHELWIPRGARPFKLYFLKIDIRDKKGRGLRLSQNQIVLRNSWEMQTRMADIVELLQVRLAYHEFLLRGLLTVFFGRVLRQCAAVTFGGPMLTDQQRRILFRYVENRITERPTPRDLASVLQLSMDYFSRVFRRTFSISPRRWLMNERMRFAAQALSTPRRSISDVAYQFGYSDVYLFSRQFKQVFGQSPRLFQRHAGP